MHSMAHATQILVYVVEKSCTFMDAINPNGEEDLESHDEVVDCMCILLPM